MFSRAVRRLYRPRASGSTPRRRRTATGSTEASMPSMSTRPRSGRISVYRQRSVVVLPAPLGPSSPVISPSRALNDTPSTATTLPKRLCKSITSIMALILWRRAIEVDVGGSRPQVIDALGIELFWIELVDEFSDELRNAAAADHVVALTLGNEQAAVGQSLEYLLAVAWRGDGIELALEDQHRRRGFEGCVEIGGARTVRPDFAGSLEQIDQSCAKHGVGVLRSRSQQIGGLAADHGELHGVSGKFREVVRQQLLLPSQRGKVALQSLGNGKRQ